MQFTISKVSNHGTANPIVARLAAQPRQLMDPFNIREETKANVCAILHGGVQQHLLTCFDILTDVKRREEEILQRIKTNGISTQSQGRVAEIESVDNLERLAHSFLYAAKLALRDIKSMVCEFFVEGEAKRRKLEDSNYIRLKEWSDGRFGKSDTLSMLLEEDTGKWIEEVYARRNAIEHPGGQYGQFHVINFTGYYDGIDKMWKCRAPSWRRNDGTPQSITNDMHVLTHNILCFSEDVLIHCLLKIPSAIPISFYEIPESKRDALCPIRLRVTIAQLDVGGAD
jgi:hypothetical protein